MDMRGELCVYDREEEQPVWRMQRHYDYYFIIVIITEGGTRQ